MEGKYYFIIMTMLLMNVFVFSLSNLASSLNLQISNSLERVFHITDVGLVALLASAPMTFLATVLSEIVQLGLCLYFLNIACDQSFNCFDLFHGFRENFGKCFGLGSLMSLISWLCEAPLYGFLYCYEKNLPMDRTVLLALIVAQILLMLLSIPIRLSLSQCYFLLLDHPELSVTDVIKKSIRFMKGNKRRLFLIRMSFLPLFLLTIPTFGIGMLWLNPYITMTDTLFFLDLMENT